MLGHPHSYHLRPRQLPNEDVYGRSRKKRRSRKSKRKSKSSRKKRRSRK